MNELEPRATTPSLAGDQSVRRAVRLLQLLAVLLGMFQAWGARHLMNPDGVSYLDIADAYRRGDWHAALNSYWNPLYTWLLAAGLSVFQPSPFWEFPVVRVVNFGIYIFALCSFHFFLLQLVRLDRLGRAEGKDVDAADIPELVWWSVGYTVFMLFSLEWIGVEVVSPDLCVAGFIFLACGLLLRLRQGDSLKIAFALGLCLGASYLAKFATTLPVLACFVIAAAWGPKRRVWPRLAAIAVGLVLIAGPWVYALSSRQGRFTLSDAGKLNYAWYANWIPGHWRGEIPGSGTPRNPYPQILQYPAAYAYDPTAPGTYPGWYDPARWFDGITPQFRLEPQLYALKNNTYMLFQFMFEQMHVALVAGMLALYAFFWDPRRMWSGLRDRWFLLVPAVLTLAMYALVWVESRFFGGALAMMWLGLLSALRFRDRPESRAVLRCITIGVCVATLTAISGKIVSRAYLVGREAPKHWNVAEFLHRNGIQPGDRVAAIGHINRCGWARLARVKITAEIPYVAEADFDAASEAVQRRAVEALFATGVRAVVSDHRVETGCPTGWIPAKGTGFQLCKAVQSMTQ
jgi:hypothetical protein